MGIFGVQAHTSARDRVWIRVAYTQLAVHIDLYRGSPHLDAVAIPATRYGRRGGLRQQKILSLARRRHQLAELEAVRLVGKIVASALTLIAEHQPARLPGVWRRVLA